MRTHTRGGARARRPRTKVLPATHVWLVCTRLWGDFDERSVTRCDRYATTVTQSPTFQASATSRTPIATWRLAVVDQKYSVGRPQNFRGGLAKNYRCFFQAPGRFGDRVTGWTGSKSKDKMRNIAKMWRQQKRQGAQREEGRERAERVQELSRRTGKIPKKKRDASPFEGASDIHQLISGGMWWE